MDYSSTSILPLLKAQIGGPPIAKRWTVLLVYIAKASETPYIQHRLKIERVLHKLSIERMQIK